jgi:Cytochrome c554 and c-prime
MPRAPIWSVMIVAVCLTVFVIVGCSSSNPKPNVAAGAQGKSNGESTKATTPPKPDPDALFVNWPTPDAAVIISGEQVGYLEPCGCTAGQKGGLARRHELIDRLRKQGWKLALFDLGSLINDPNKPRHGGPLETAIKFDYSLKALTKIGYDAVALSPVDFKMGVFETVGRILQMGDRPKFVSANVEPIANIAAPTPGQSSKFASTLRVATGPYKIGVTSVIDLAELEKLVDSDKGALLTIKPADEAAAAALADLEKDTDLQVLMVQGSVEFARKLAQANPGYDIVMATSLSDPEKNPVMLNNDKTMLVQVGRKGQYVGVVGLFKSGRPRFQRVELGEKFNKRYEPMRKLIDEEMQEEFKRAEVLDKFVRLPAPSGAPDGSTYVGAATCQVCHPNTYAKWASTKHAQAYEDLVKDPHDPRRNREHDAECVTCHTTGFEYNGGFRTAEATAYLKGNQCENCHGPGSAHAADPDNRDYRKAIARSADEIRHRCLDCHDEDNSPHFDFPVFWGKIAHKKLDVFIDPKVHQGIQRVDPPKPAPK